MQQKAETKNDIPHALREEIAANRELLKHVDENAAFDTPESLAALRSVIEELKTGTAATILMNIEKIEIEAPLRQPLGKALSGIFSLKNIVGFDNSAILPDKYKPLLGKISHKEYLTNIKENTELAWNHIANSV
jgi:hypothetical protein